MTAKDRILMKLRVDWSLDEGLFSIEVGLLEKWIKRQRT